MLSQHTPVPPLQRCTASSHCIASPLLLAAGLSALCSGLPLADANKCDASSQNPISFLNLCGLHTLPQRWLPVPHRQGGHPSLSSSCSSSSSTSPPSSPHQLLQPHHHNRYGSLPPSLSLSPPPSRLCGDWGLVGWQHVVPTFFPSIV